MKGTSLPITLNTISREVLVDLYILKRQSVAQISLALKCSQNKINYWLKKHGIEKRNISDAMYHFKNPLGDPFLLKQPATLEEGILFGMGLGLFWGEGTKRGKGGMRLSNSDPKLIRKFIEFLEKFLTIDKNKLKISIQIFGDISPQKSLAYWIKELNLKKEQFYKPLVIEVRGKGTYKYKSEYGTVIIYLNNIKIKKLLCEMIENIK
jgi:hypothetical protein